jgi:hypothetical protein
LGRIPSDGLDERLVGRHPRAFQAAAGQHQRAAPTRGRRQLLEQPGLTDPGLAQDRHDPAATGRGGVVDAEQPAQLIVAAVAGGARRDRGLLVGPPGEDGVVLEDPLVEVLQLAAGVDTQLLAQRAPQDAKRVQRLGLPAIPVACQHELSPSAFAQRVTGDHGLQLPHQVVVAAQCQLGVGQVLARGLAQLLQAGGLRLGERLVRELRQRPPPPQRQRLAQQPRRGRRVTPGRGLAALTDQPLGQARVHDVGWCL